MIGILDSGVGGLTVLRHIRGQLPQVDLVYLADQAHVPYGSRSALEVRLFTKGITRFFLEWGVELVVVACNTASAAALTYLRQTFPDLPFVGMEPAVKPAAAHTRSGKVGVMATRGTFGSPRYASLMHRFAQEIEVFEDPCVGLVELIESGHIDTPETAALLQTILTPMLAQGVDTLVLGCTHYPFVQPLIAQVIAAHPRALPGPVTIIDPAPAVARQATRVYQRLNRELPLGEQPGAVRLVTTGAAWQLDALAVRLLGESFPVETAVWQDDILRPS